MTMSLRLRELLLPALAVVVGVYILWREIAWFEELALWWDYFLSLAIVVAVASVLAALARSLVARFGATWPRRTTIAIIFAPIIGLAAWHGLYLLSIIPFDQQHRAWTSVWALALNKVSGRLAVGAMLLFAAVTLVRWRSETWTVDAREGVSREA